MELDRKILQREKFEMIFMERMTAPNDPAPKQEEQKSEHIDTVESWALDLELDDKEEVKEEPVNKKVKIEIENIKQVLVDRMV